MDQDNDNNLKEVEKEDTHPIYYVSKERKMRRERATNLQIFSIILVVWFLISCLLIGVFLYLSMMVETYITIGLSALVLVGDLIFLIYTLVVYKKRIKKEDEEFRLLYEKEREEKYGKDC